VTVVENGDPLVDVPRANVADGRAGASQLLRDLRRSEAFVGEEQDPATVRHSALGRTTTEIAANDLEVFLNENDRTGGRSRHSRVPRAAPVPLVQVIGRRGGKLMVNLSGYLPNTALVSVPAQKFIPELDLLRSLPRINADKRG